MSQIATDLKLLNLTQTQHQHKPPAKYSGGKEWLDYGLATQRVANVLLFCDYNAFNQRFAIDHRAYYFDLNNKVLFGNMTQKLAPHSLRVLKSTNIERVTQQRGRFQFDLSNQVESGAVSVRSAEATQRWSIRIKAAQNAVNPVMIKELQFEISRLSRWMFLQTNYDASACYDRIIPNLAMVVSRRIGVPKTATIKWSHIKTGNISSPDGVRTLSILNWHSPDMPIYGTGQGSGNSPTIWCFLSSLPYNCARNCNPD